MALTGKNNHFYSDPILYGTLTNILGIEQQNELNDIEDPYTSIYNIVIPNLTSMLNNNPTITDIMEALGLFINTTNPLANQLVTQEVINDYYDKIITSNIYVLERDLSTNYALATSLNALEENLSNTYATTAALDLVDSTVDAITAGATPTTLSSYATTADLAAVTEGASPTTLSSYALLSDVGQFTIAKKGVGYCSEGYWQEDYIVQDAPTNLKELAAAHAACEDWALEQFWSANSNYDLYSDSLCYSDSTFSSYAINNPATAALICIGIVDGVVTFIQA
jgi:hypothetical protein